MLFNSLHFLLFFPIVIAIYFSIPHKFKWIVLLISSYYFYMSWRAEYIILIIISTLINYFAGILIYQYKTKKKRTSVLTINIILNLGLLFAFKYFNFFSDSVRETLNIFSINLNPLTLKVLLPIGISFYTFQTLSYTIDIYRKEIKPEKHLGIFAVYVAFFPQLVAGPIERAKNLLPQFFKKHLFDYRQVTDGLKLMLWGFFKKLVIADRLSIVVNAVYNNVGDYTGIPLILATFFFAFQIYCDFSGYSDIAIGASQIMGIKLMDNFKRPYFSKSIAEFWRRWHISLSTWFKDYLYIPLGGNRVSIPRWYLNLLVVFLVSGLWHGASWTFVIWGGLHGIYLIFGAMSKNIRKIITNYIKLYKFPKTHQLIKFGTTFILVNLAWVFFRANSLSDAIYVLTHLFSEISLTFSGINLGGIGWEGLIIAFISIAFMELVHILQRQNKMRRFLSDKQIWLRWTIYLMIIFAIILFGVFESKEFIYFQF